MAAMRASYSIEPKVLTKFNEMVPPGERSRLVETLMKRALAAKERELEAAAEDFATHPDFAEARADGTAWAEGTLRDGLAET